MKAPLIKGSSHGQPVGSTRPHATTAAILGMAAKGNAGWGKRKVPAKWAQQYKQLLALRARVELERSGHAIAAQQPLEAFSMDMADAASDEFDHVLSLSALSAEQDALYEIDEALRRIVAGTYGICQLTGKPIPRKRLEALPWTRFASEAERQLELAGQAPRPHLGELRSVTGPPTGNLEEAEVGQVETEPPPIDETLAQVVPSPGLDLSKRLRAQKTTSSRRSQRATARPETRPAPRK